MKKSLDLIRRGSLEKFTIVSRLTKGILQQTSVRVPPPHLHRDRD